MKKSCIFFYSITKALIYVTVIPLGQFCKRKVKSAIRKLIKKPLKINPNLVAKPENQESIVIAEGDDNDLPDVEAAGQSW